MSGTLLTSTLKVYGPITPSDVADVTVVLPDATTPGAGTGTTTTSEGIGLGLNVGGTVRLTRPDGVIVNLTLPAGWHPLRYKRVHSTGTSATGITGGFRVP